MATAGRCPHSFRTASRCGRRYRRRVVGTEPGLERGVGDKWRGEPQTGIEEQSPGDPPAMTSLGRQRSGWGRRFRGPRRSGQEWLSRNVGETWALGAPSIILSGPVTSALVAPTRPCSIAQPGMLSPTARAMGSGPQSSPAAHEVSGGACNAVAVARTGGGGGRKGREGSGCRYPSPPSPPPGERTESSLQWLRSPEPLLALARRMCQV